MNIVELVEDLNTIVRKDINRFIDLVLGKPKPDITFMTKSDGYMYFVPTNYNALFSVDLSTGKCDLKCVFGNEKLYENFSGNAFCHNGYVIICPFNFCKIHIWNVEEAREEKLKITERKSEEPAYLPRVIVANESVLFFPSLSKDLYSLDIDTWKVEKILDIYKCFLSFNGNGYTVFSRDSGYIYKNKIYFSMSDAHYVAEYDILRNEIMFYELDLEDQIILSDGVENSLYMLSDAGIIYEWNINDHKLDKKTKVTYSNFNLLRIQSTARSNDSLYYMAPNDKFGIEYNIRLNSARIGNYSELFKFQHTDSCEYHFALQDSDKKLYFISNAYELLIFDLGSKRYSNINLHFDDEQLRMLYFLQTAHEQKDSNIGRTIYQTI